MSLSLLLSLLGEELHLWDQRQSVSSRAVRIKGESRARLGASRNIGKEEHEQRSIYNNYTAETHYNSWIDFSQHASIPRHYPLYDVSPSTRSYIYVLNQFSMVNIMSL
jgi:hypothetical protein